MKKKKKIDKSEWSTPHPGPLYPQERDPIHIAQGAGWAPGKVWTDAENFVLRGIRVRRKSLYQLSYPGSRILKYTYITIG